MSEDGGAVAVVVAITLVVLFGMGALVVDVGQIYFERRQLQTGAEAGALALAQECAEGAIDCATATVPTLATVAEDFADENAKDGRSAVPAAMGHGSDSAVCEQTNAPAPNPLGGTNTVKVSTETLDASGTESFITYVLGPVLGFANKTVTACAVASWGNVGGANTVPLTFSECEWDDFTGGAGAAGLPTGTETVFFHTSLPNECNGSAGQDIPGGFGWLQPVGGLSGCTADFESSEWVRVDTGSGAPTPAASTGCTQAFFASLIGQTILMPIFSEVCQNGSGYPACPPSLPNFKHHRISGFAAFVLEGYRFGGSFNSTPAPCSNPDRCVRGQFVAYYDYGSQPTTGGPNFGVITIGLTG